VQAVPQVIEQLAEIGRVLALGTVSAVGLFAMLALGAYLWLCAGSCRQWSALERRWARPAEERGIRYLMTRLL
jgi:hypothetical protein